MRGLPCRHDRLPAERTPDCEAQLEVDIYVNLCFASRLYRSVVVESIMHAPTARRSRVRDRSIGRRHVDVRERVARRDARAPRARTRPSRRDRSCRPRRISPPPARSSASPLPLTSTATTCCASAAGQARDDTGGVGRREQRRRPRARGARRAPRRCARGAASRARDDVTVRGDEHHAARRRATYAAGVYSVTVIFNVPGRSRCTDACSTHGSRSTRRATAPRVDEQQVVVDAARRTRRAPARR